MVNKFSSFFFLIMWYTLLFKEEDFWGNDTHSIIWILPQCERDTMLVHLMHALLKLFSFLPYLSFYFSFPS
jgi:hypothetical protein